MEKAKKEQEKETMKEEKIKEKGNAGEEKRKEEIKPKEKAIEEKGKETIEEELKKTKEKLGEYAETLQRLQAEFENYKKRIEKEKPLFAEYGKGELIKELLPVLDSIDSALRHLKGEKKAVEGIELIRKQFLEVLEKEGVKEIKCLGQEFNPLLHECMQSACEKGKREEEILEEFQKGYCFGDKVIRHSKVKINKLKEEKEIEEKGE